MKKYTMEGGIIEMENLDKEQKKEQNAYEAMIECLYAAIQGELSNLEIDTINNIPGMNLIVEEDQDDDVRYIGIVVNRNLILPQKQI
jgi:hypothetical protein